MRPRERSRMTTTTTKFISQLWLESGAGAKSAVERGDVVNRCATQNHFVLLIALNTVKRPVYRLTA